MKLSIPPEIMHIYGSFGIHSYGFFIALAIITTVWLLRKNPRFIDLKLENHLLNIMFISIIAGFIGGRLIEIITDLKNYPEWYDWFAFWQGGFSILGSIIGIATITPLYLYSINIPILPTFDLVAIYAPLLQSIARLGCLVAGCCYGIATKSKFGIIYTHPEVLAPHNITLHATQLYSSITLFIIFLFLYFIGQHTIKKQGQLFITYLILVSLERFIIDFWRADRSMIANLISIHQLIALGIIIIACIAQYLINTFTQKHQ